MTFINELQEYAALRNHLTHTHYPPLSPLFVDTARTALAIARAAHKNETWELLEEMLELPNGIEKSVGDIIHELHLEDFVW